MAKDKLTIWCNATFPAEITAKLKAAIVPHELIFPAKLAATNLSAGEADPNLAHADIAFGQPDPDQVVKLPNVKWVHLTSAGYTRYDTDRFKAAMKARGSAFTNSSSVYDEPCAQHLLAMMLANSRMLPACLGDQSSDRSWVYADTRYKTFLLQGQTVILYGFGAIGRRLVEMLAPFKMNLIAVKRNPTSCPGVKVVTPKEADALLATADHIVNILPASPESEGFFNVERLAKMRHHAHFYNVGRGTTVDQQGLLACLETGRLAGAYLDVTTPEPLGADSPLWSAPNCYITPHIAGGHVNEFERLVGHFVENLVCFTSGKELIDRIV